MLVALAHAVLLHNSKEKVKPEALANQLERASQAVKLAYSQCPSYDKLVPALLQYPVEVITPYTLKLPLGPYAMQNSCLLGAFCILSAFILDKPSGLSAILSIA